MKPLCEEGRSIIADGSAADVPDPELQARLWETLSQRLDAPLPATAAAASEALIRGGGAGSAFSSLGAKWVLGALLCAGLSAVGFHALRSEDRPARAPTHPAPEAPREARPQGPARPSGGAAVDVAVSTLSEETRLIAAAQQALQASSPKRALTLLDEHRTRFPRGELAQERDGARVIALCVLGRSGEARAARHRFVRDWPDSPLMARIVVGCGGTR